jgi:hypothetical protein
LQRQYLFYKIKFWELRAPLNDKEKHKNRIADLKEEVKELTKILVYKDAFQLAYAKAKESSPSKKDGAKISKNKVSKKKKDDF